MRAATAIMWAWVGLSPQPAVAQWSWSNLEPPVATFSQVGDTTIGQQVGAVIPLGGGYRASLWSGTAATWVDIHPPAYASSRCFGTDGSQQVGSADVYSGIWPPSQPLPRAGLWTGTAASFVSLHPPGAYDSVALGVAGGQQVGWVRLVAPNGHACVWTGTAASMIDLHPPGATSSYATRTDGTLQGGVVDNHASIWAGTASTWVDLHPAGATTSSVTDLAAGQQVGSATIGGQSHAAIWSGSPSTFSDIHPAGATASQLTGTTGVWQVGRWFGPGFMSHAGIWKGSASTFHDLNSLLAGTFTDSWATAVAESGGNIIVAGMAWNYPGAYDLTAVIWILPSFALTAATTGGGVGDLTIGLVGIRPTATHTWLFVSGTPAPGGPGTGSFFGLFFPDPILFSVMAIPPTPLSPLHFPVAANPYAAGPLVFGPGSLSALAGQIWDVTAVCYGPADGISGVAPVVRLTW